MDIEQPSAQLLARQIGELLDRRRTAHARKLIAQALAAHPGDVEVLVQAARADLIDDDHAAARATLGQVLARAPSHLYAQCLMLALLTDAGELVQAEQLALSLIASHPQSADLFVAYARVMFRALKFDKARALATEALAMQPENEAALRMLALCDVVSLRRGTDSEALRRLLAQHPEDKYALSLVLAAMVQSGEQRAALRVARQLLRAQPDDPAWLANVRALSAQNHWSMLPLWPLQKGGWWVSVAFWVGSVLLLRTSRDIAPAAYPWLSGAILAYVVYSWVWPPLLRRWLSR